MPIELSLPISRVNCVGYGACQVRRLSQNNQGLHLVALSPLVQYFVLINKVIHQGSLLYNKSKRARCNRDIRRERDEVKQYSTARILCVDLNHQAAVCGEPEPQALMDVMINMCFEVPSVRTCCLFPTSKRPY